MVSIHQYILDNVLGMHTVLVFLEELPVDHRADRLVVREGALERPHVRTGLEGEELVQHGQKDIPR